MYDYYSFTTIVYSTNFAFIISVLVVKLTLFLRYPDWLTFHFERFSIFVFNVGG